MILLWELHQVTSRLISIQHRCMRLKQKRICVPTVLLINKQFIKFTKLMQILCFKDITLTLCSDLRKIISFLSFHRIKLDIPCISFLFSQASFFFSAFFYNISPLIPPSLSCFLKFSLSSFQRNRHNSCTSLSPKK